MAGLGGRGGFGRGAFAPQPYAGGRGSFSTTEVCIYFQRGYCQRGDTCLYRHEKPGADGAGGTGGGFDAGDGDVGAWNAGKPGQGERVALQGEKDGGAENYTPLTPHLIPTHTITHPAVAAAGAVLNSVFGGGAGGAAGASAAFGGGGGGSGGGAGGGAVRPSAFGGVGPAASAQPQQQPQQAGASGGLEFGTATTAAAASLNKRAAKQAQLLASRGVLGSKAAADDGSDSNIAMQLQSKRGRVAGVALAVRQQQSANANSTELK
ncbi:hypothetical protein T492DRAFT_841109 [Pavlovales sp. CCMP2436]|nr:hypothetical protein T492DRAFT_841109 [Pavlovales sp. CCMP2436]